MIRRFFAPKYCTYHGNRLIPETVSWTNGYDTRTGDEIVVIKKSLRCPYKVSGSGFQCPFDYAVSRKVYREKR